VTILEQMIREVLGKLQMLGDGSTANLDADKVTTHGASSGIPKRGPMSLYEYYKAEFEAHADDPRQLRVLVMLAWDDYEDFRFKADHRIELRRGELLDNDPRDGGKAEEAQAKRIVEWYEGKDPLYVAFTESRSGAKVTEGWVKKARRMHGRNEHDGRPRSSFLDMDEEDRTRKVASLANRGMSQQKAADRLGVGKSTVQRYWPEQSLAA